MANLTEEDKARRALNRRRKAALQAEADAVRRDAKWREWDEKEMRLTWEEYVAGVACRGCGLPTGDHGNSTPPSKLDDQAREKAKAEFEQRHPDCRSYVWGSESGPTHCGLCCPPLPMRQEQIDRVAATLARIGTKSPDELATWKLTLTCDHVVEKTQHRDTDYVLADAVVCPECQQIRGIVTTERVSRDDVCDDVEKRHKAGELAKARSEHERLQKKADSARRRIRKLERQCADLDKAR